MDEIGSWGDEPQEYYSKYSMGSATNSCSYARKMRISRRFKIGALQEHDFLLLLSTYMYECILYSFP